jgi:hypothetical protein
MEKRNKEDQCKLKKGDYAGLSYGKYCMLSKGTLSDLGLKLAQI